MKTTIEIPDQVFWRSQAAGRHAVGVTLSVSSSASLCTGWPLVARACPIEAVQDLQPSLNRPTTRTDAKPRLDIELG